VACAGRVKKPSHNRGDYQPAIRLFRPLAEAGNPKAQTQGQAMAGSLRRLQLSGLRILIISAASGTLAVP
jgi:hypothetical protein